MSKKIIIVAHPNLEKSVINKRWVEELEKYPEEITVHNIYEKYPDRKIDIGEEQKLLNQYDTIILQFPLYWFNCTPFLKQWLDDVFTYGWAYGSKSNGLRNKKIGLAISAGLKESGGEIQVSFEDLLYPYKTMIKYCNAIYCGHFMLFDTHRAVENGSLEDSAPQYAEFVKSR